MNDQELDRRIRLALEETCAPEAVARLEDFWRRRQRIERRRRVARRCLATAASAALLAGILWRPFGAPDRADPPMAVRPSAPRAASPVNHSLPGREPTAYERLMFTAQVRQEETLKASRLAKEIDATIDRLAANPDLPVDQWAAASLFESPDAELLLQRRLRRANCAQAETVIRLLARHGTSRSTSTLLSAASEPSLRSLAVAAIERLAGPAGLAEAARQTNDRAVRQALAERLLVDGSDPALRSYLSLISNPALRSDALAAANGRPASSIEESTEGLLSLLQDEEREIRVAAAIALGSINGPHVTERLIAIVSGESAARPEVWLALLACRDESASQFLLSASRHPRLLGQINNARMTWARMTQ